MRDRDGAADPAIGADEGRKLAKRKRAVVLASPPWIFLAIVEPQPAADEVNSVTAHHRIRLFQLVSKDGIFAVVASGEVVEELLRGGRLEFERKLLPVAKGSAAIAVKYSATYSSTSHSSLNENVFVFLAEGSSLRPVLSAPLGYSTLRSCRSPDCGARRPDLASADGELPANVSRGLRRPPRGLQLSGTEV